MSRPQEAKTHIAHTSAGDFFDGAEIAFVSDTQASFTLSVGDKVALEWPSNHRSRLIVTEISGEMTTLSCEQTGVSVRIRPQKSSAIGDFIRVAAGMEAHHYVVISRD